MGAIVTYSTGTNLDLATTRGAMETMAARRRERGAVDLAEIARFHAASRVLSPSTRAYFADLAERGATPLTHTGGQRAHDAYFEAAGSCATRGAQSMDRRYMLADLHMLREADLAGEAIGPRVRVFAVRVADEVDGTLTVTENLDGTVSAEVTADLSPLL